MVHLHNGILRNRKNDKTLSYSFCESRIQKQLSWVFLVWGLFDGASKNVCWSGPQPSDNLAEARGYASKMACSYLPGRGDTTITKMACSHGAGFC